MMRRTIALLAVAALIVLAGCSSGSDAPATPTPESGETIQNDDSLGGNEITRFVDEEAGVVCYKYNGYEKGGLSCLPIEQTNLRE